MACPVCRAAFRGTEVCSRCGADLAPLMRLAVRAWRLRQSSRAALLAGDFAGAHQLALEAENLAATPAGHALRMVSGWGCEVL